MLRCLADVADPNDESLLNANGEVYNPEERNPRTQVHFGCKERWTESVETPPEAADAFEANRWYRYNPFLRRLYRIFKCPHKQWKPTVAYGGMQSNAEGLVLAEIFPGNPWSTHVANPLGHALAYEESPHIACERHIAATNIKDIRKDSLTLRVHLSLAGSAFDWFQLTPQIAGCVAAYPVWTRSNEILRCKLPSGRDFCVSDVKMGFDPVREVTNRRQGHSPSQQYPATSAVNYDPVKKENDLHSFLEQDMHVKEEEFDPDEIIHKVKTESRSRSRSPSPKRMRTSTSTGSRNYYFNNDEEDVDNPDPVSPSDLLNRAEPSISGETSFSFNVDDYLLDLPLKNEPRSRSRSPSSKQASSPSRQHPTYSGDFKKEDIEINDDMDKIRSDLESLNEFLKTQQPN